MGPWLVAHHPLSGFPSFLLSLVRENEDDLPTAASAVGWAPLWVPTGVLGPGAEDPSAGSQSGSQLLERVLD